MNFTAGFGLGALNDADDDDIDVYDGSLNSARRHMAYDISEHDDGDRIVIGSNKHHEQNKPEQVSPRHGNRGCLSSRFQEVRIVCADISRWSTCFVGVYTV